MSSGLFRFYVFKSGLLRGPVCNTTNVKNMHPQGQCCLDVMSTRSGLFRDHVFKVRLV